MTTMDRKLEKKRWTPKKIGWLAGGTLTITLLIYGLLTAGGSSTLRVEADKLTISTVTRGPFQEYIPVNGEVAPQKTVYLDATVGGRVIQIFVEKGSFVAAGDSILKLDNTDLHLDIMYREAQLFEQINNLRNTRLAIEQNSLTLRAQLLEIDHQLAKSKREHEQAISLKERNLISNNEYERIQEDFDYWSNKRILTLESQRQDSILRAVQVEQLEASVARMQANLEVVKQKLENLVIRAPVTGHLTSLEAEVGQSLGPREHLGKIDIMEGFKIRTTVDEYYISRVSEGQSGEVKIAGEEFDLVVETVYPEVRQGRFEIDMEFVGSQPEGIRRGQTVQIRLALGDLSEAVLLPRGGFYQTTGGHWVFVVDKSGGAANRRTISLGMMNPQVYEVLDGLEPGDQVITSSYDNFENFAKLVFKDK
jgi:HlyD family secretion protein